jgi:hypothetical protein
MARQASDLLNDERGLAMVLAVGLIALLTSVALWLILESKSNMQITRAYERTERTLRLAEGAAWLNVRCLDTQTPTIPSSGTELQDVTPSDSYLAQNQELGSGSGRKLSPRIFSRSDFYNTLPPEGWSLNEPSRYFTRFYEGRGVGEVPMTGAQGNALSRVYNFIQKVAR